MGWELASGWELQGQVSSGPSPCIFEEKLLPFPILCKITDVPASSRALEYGLLPRGVQGAISMQAQHGVHGPEIASSERKGPFQAKGLLVPLARCRAKYGLHMCQPHHVFKGL